MRYDPEKQRRRSIRLKGNDYASPGGYFIILAAQGRVCLFGEIIEGEMQYSDKGRIAYECWHAIPDHFPNAELGAFIIMPNHMHGIIILHERTDAVWSAISSPTVGAHHDAPSMCNQDRWDRSSVNINHP